MIVKSIPNRILYLSAADVLACDVRPSEVTEAVEVAFRETAIGRAETQAAFHVPVSGLAAFRGKGGVLRGAAYGGMKWYGYFPENLQVGQSEYRPVIILNEAETGFVVSIMSGDWITARRTAAISAVGAKWLARPESSRIGFVGCGGQARANLEALLPLFPVKSVIAYSRRAETAEIFARFCRDKGLIAEATTDPDHAISEADIVVTSVPRHPTFTPFLEAGWVSPGAFVSMVDVGRSWKRDEVDALSARVTDEPEQDHALAHITNLDTSLAQVVGGLHVGRQHPDDRIALVCSGNGLADVAVAALVYEKARALGLGQSLAP